MHPTANRAEVAPAPLLSIGTRTRMLTDRRGRTTSVEVEGLVDKRSMKLVAYRYPDGSIECAGGNDKPAPPPEPLGVIRRRDPARAIDRSDPPPEVTVISSEQVRMAEMLRPGTMKALRSMLHLRSRP